MYIPSYSNVDVKGLWLKNNGPNRKGDGIMVLPLYGNVKLVADLTPNTWLRVAFPFNITGQYEAVSFLKHCDPPGKPEGLNLGIVLDRGHASAVLAASIFHFGTFTIPQAKEYLASQGVPVRR